jgi:hypothetical protein
MNDGKDVLDRVLNTKDFLHSVFVKDNFDDWTLAKELGDYLLQLMPDLFPAHLIRARAFRHLGERDRAADDLRRCRALFPKTIGTLEEGYLPMLEEEERMLAS